MTWDDHELKHLLCFLIIAVFSTFRGLLNNHFKSMFSDAVFVCMFTVQFKYGHKNGYIHTQFIHLINEWNFGISSLSASLLDKIWVQPCMAVVFNLILPCKFISHKCSLLVIDCNFPGKKFFYRVPCSIHCKQTVELQLFASRYGQEMVMLVGWKVCWMMVLLGLS